MAKIFTQDGTVLINGISQPPPTRPPSGGRSQREVLLAIGRRIERPEHYTTGAVARDQYGHPVSASSPHAVCFCLMGATRAEVDRGDHDLGQAMLERICDAAAELFPTNPSPVDRDHAAARAIVAHALASCPR